MHQSNYVTGTSRKRLPNLPKVFPRQERTGHELTEKAVSALALPAGKADPIFFDDKLPGFGVRLRDRGAPTWVFQAKLGGKHLRMTLGKVAAMKAGAARALAERYHAAVKEGRNPQTEKAGEGGGAGAHVRPTRRAIPAAQEGGAQAPQSH